MTPSTHNRAARRVQVPLRKHQNNDTHGRATSTSTADEAQIALDRFVDVHGEPNIAALDKLKSRKSTIDATVNLSRLDCIIGVFFPKRIQRKVGNTITLRSINEPSYHSRQGSPYVIRVAVWSSENSDETHVMSKRAQCTLDTGNHQGNLVSKGYLTNVLGFDESNFVELSNEEREGGISASGHTVIPEAAVHLTWYHPKHPRTFNDMRFLVVDSPDFDLVIGEKSIVKHKLLGPPNFAITEDGIHYFNRDDEKKLKTLDIAVKRLDSEIETCREDIAEAKRDDTKTTLNEKLGKLLESKIKAESELQDYREQRIKNKDTDGDKKTSANMEKGDGMAKEPAEKGSNSTTITPTAEASGSDKTSGLRGIFTRKKNNPGS